MRLSNGQSKTVVSLLPNDLELYHGKFSHNKVPHCKLYRLIPKGKKYIVWFKKYDTHVNCYLIELANFNLRKISFKSVSIYNASFDEMLTIGRYGTICFGTFVNVNRRNYLSIEDIFYYKNKNVCKMKWKYKYNYITSVLEDCSHLPFTKYDISFGTPILSETRKELDNTLIQLPYSCYCVEGFNPEYTNVYKTRIIEPTKEISGIFKLQAEVKSDIYSIYCENNILGTAYIPSYTLSVYLNRYFRNIKENNNLDTLEESDSEDDFEDIRLDKYVDTTKQLPFRCVYNKKFRAWIPEKHIEEDEISYTSYKTVKYL